MNLITIEELPERWARWAEDSGLPFPSAMSVIVIPPVLPFEYEPDGAIDRSHQSLAFACRVLSTRNPWNEPIFDFILEHQRDTPYNRHVGFWKRHATEPRPDGPTWEASVVLTRDRLLFAAMSQIDSLEARQSRMLQVMSQAIVVPSRAIDPGSLLEDFLAVPAVRADHFKLFGFVPTLAALLATRQACVLNRASADDEVQVIGPRALIQQLAPIFTVS